MPHQSDSRNPSIGTFFNSANKTNLKNVCAEFYDKNIEFKDPLTHLRGLEKMIRYYENLYENVIDIKFKITKEFFDSDEVTAFWTMTLRHKRLKNGSPVTLDGVSYVRFKNGKAIYHRDYFDAATMLYENIPILGATIKFIKNLAGKHD